MNLIRLVVVPVMFISAAVSIVSFQVNLNDIIKCKIKNKRIDKYNMVLLVKDVVDIASEFFILFTVIYL